MKHSDRPTAARARKCFLIYLAVLRQEYRNAGYSLLFRRTFQWLSNKATKSSHEKAQKAQNQALSELGAPRIIRISDKRVLEFVRHHRLDGVDPSPRRF